MTSSAKTECNHCGALGPHTIHGRAGARTRYLCSVCGKTFRTDTDPEEEEPGVYGAGNYRTIISKMSEDGAPTPEDLCKTLGFDLEEWKIEKAKPGYHQMGWKDAEGKGHAKTLYNLKVWLVRRVPVSCDWPQIAGAAVNPVKPRKFNISRRLKRKIVMPDVQAGFKRNMDTGELTPLHDPVATDLFLRVVSAIQPDGLDALGDNTDLPDWSDKYLVTPEFYWTTQPTLNWLASYLFALRKHVGPGESDAEFRYLEGNHEARMLRLLTRNMIAGWGLRQANAPAGDHPVMSIPFLLGLDDMKISWYGGYPKNGFWINDNLRVRHAEKLSQKPGLSAGKSLEGARTSMIFGHSHRLEVAHQTVHARDKVRVYGAYNLGTLAKIDGTVPGNAPDENWQQGFGIVDYEDGGKNLFQVTPVNIYHGWCCVEGRVFEAESDESGGE